ncbi:NirD/YgiW/YdeI family stress tolerance protein [Vibrio campbellii]|uniref:NirD/YgiW/YdeI family stress tolerance protein n=1 Tax=Vibrio campbellii TaxID=680 RepID=UPI000CD362B8|nr:NirD/YgiW/YdeI family stress tolerance protein [Vibrio campbellii]AUW07351.1 hypothetical protein C1N51_27180 [Vibrio campbellii]
MKSKLLLTLAMAPLFANAFGNQPQANGFVGPSSGISTVRQVLDAGIFSDDMPVILTGRVMSHLGGEMYMFRDNTGEMTVEIDHDKWYGLTITPETTVRLSGEIDKDITGVKVDVDFVRILTPHGQPQ